MQFDPWAAISYGQNLPNKGLTVLSKVVAPTVLDAQSITFRWIEVKEILDVGSGAVWLTRQAG